MPAPYLGKKAGFFSKLKESLSRAYNDFRYGYEFEVTDGGKATFSYENGSNTPIAATKEQQNEVTALGFLKSKLQDYPEATFTLTEDITGLGKKGDSVSMKQALQHTGVRGRMEGGLDAVLSRYYENTGSGMDAFRAKPSWAMHDLGRVAAAAAVGVVGFKATQLGVSLITGD